MATVDKQWERFFDEAYLPLYKPWLSAERTAHEVEGVTRLLELPPGSALLDMGCAYGRHALPLAQAGHQVTGLDRSEASLEQARTAAEAAGVRVHWCHADMRAMPFEQTFDGVICLFSSFGYGQDQQEDQGVLQQVYQALKPAGRFLLEVAPLTRVVHTFVPSVIVRYEDGLIALEERHLDLLSSRYEVRLTLVETDGSRREYSHSQRLYSLTELVQMHKQAGLRTKVYYGDLFGAPVTLESRLVLVSQREQG